jgi:predicted MFS family arabinose efflux permease
MTAPVNATGGTPERAALSRGVTLLMAVTAGLAVANVYYAQPLLDAIGHELAIGEARLGGVVAMTQAGYGLGLLLIAPIGDLVDRRRLILVQVLLTTITLCVAAFAATPIVFLAAMACTGMLAVVAQVIVAHGASLAAPGEQGRVVGTVTTGIVLGILLARTAAGALSDLFGWRAVYAASAAADVIVVAVLLVALPAQRVRNVPISYVRLVATLFELFAQVPMLRIRAMLAFFIFFTITVLLTPLVLPLSAPPFGLSHTQVGLFGLAGAAGALGASSAGRLADRGLAQRITGIALALMLLSWLPIALLPYSLWGPIIGIVIIDYGLQAVHVANQSLIYRVRPEAQTRLAAGYMMFYSIGSAAGSMLSTLTYVQLGWSGVCLLGGSASAAGLAFWAATKGRRGTWLL